MRSVKSRMSGIKQIPWTFVAMLVCLLMNFGAFTLSVLDVSVRDRGTGWLTVGTGLAGVAYVAYVLRRSVEGIQHDSHKQLT